MNGPKEGILLTMAKATKLTMDALLEENGDAFKKVNAGDTVKGTVLSVKKHEILIDLGAQGVGLVPRREASFARNLNVGDEVTTSVIESEMKDGYVLLSLRKAVKDKGWDEITAKLEAGEIVESTCRYIFALLNRFATGSVTNKCCSFGVARFNSFG